MTFPVPEIRQYLDLYDKWEPEPLGEKRVADLAAILAAAEGMYAVLEFVQEGADVRARWRELTGEVEP